MKGEFTRLTFRPQRHYTGVRLQQGRVQLDADFNEQVDIGEHRDRVTTRDVIGPAGAPDDGSGFAIAATVSIGGLTAAGGVQRAAGGRATLLAGNGWAAQAAPAGAAGADLHAIDAVDGSRAIAVGERGTVLRTTNSSTWTKVALPGGATPDLLGVAWTTANAAWAVGAGGALFATANDGGTWTSHAIAGVAETLRAIATAGGGVWAAGDAGRIVALQGGTWQPQVSPTKRTLRGIAFGSATHGWAVGDDATILRTTNAGTTWTAQAAPAGVATSLRAVSAQDNDRAWAVGAGGTVLRTTNGGTTWTLVAPHPSLAGADLRAVLELGGDLAVVGGDPWALARVQQPASGAPTWTPVAPPATAGDLLVGPGRMYVDGVLCENERPIRYFDQPDLHVAATPAAGRYLAYLDVWQRHVTAVERGELREVALGGPDTATRTQTVWQVRLDAIGASEGCEAIAPGSASPATESTGELRAQASPEPLAGDDCMVAAGGGYRRLENQLYRVEVHAPGAPGAATFKWSRDNGAILGRLVATAPGAAPHPTITVAVAGRDAAEAFAGAKYVELTDEERVLDGLPGILLEVKFVQGDVISLVDPPPALSALGTAPTVRRWDGTKPLTDGPFTPLEDGVEVQFGPGQYRTGDWWSVPARTGLGTVEWPSQDGAPVFQPRHGVEHRACPLAVVQVDAAGAFTVVRDCRPLFTPLALQTHAFPAGGSGQDIVAPDGVETPTPYPLVVAVLNGRRAVDHAWVRFTVASGSSALGAAKGNPVEIETVNGLASCLWWLRNTADHQVEARLLDGPGGAPVGPAMFFTASRRAPAGGSGGACTVTVAEGDDLQAAVEKLPVRGGELCLAAGTWDLDDALRITGRERVTVSGRGPSTVLRGGHEVVVLVQECRGVTVRGVRVEAGGVGRAPGEEHIQGALTFRECTDVRVLDCELTCPDAWGGRAQACLAVHVPTGGGKEPQRPVERTIVERNRCDVGADQVGLLVVDPRSVRIAANHVTLGPGDERRIAGKLQPSVGEVVRWMLDGLRPEPGPGREVVEDDMPVIVAAAHPTLDLWRAFMDTGPHAELRQRGPAAALRDFLDRVVADGRDRGEWSMVFELVERLRCVGQGIVVGGRPLSVQVLDNVVEQATQGIHVGSSVSPEDDAEAPGIDDVTVSRNVVHCRVPGAHGRERHAVLVANTKSAVVGDTYATLERVGGGRIDQFKIAGRRDGIAIEEEGGTPTPVDGIRVMGHVGPFLTVHASSLRGFTVGVRVQSTISDEQVMWMVRETLAENAHAAVVAHPLTNEQFNVTRS